MRDYESFAQECREFLFDTHAGARQYRIYESYIMRFAYGVDASCYRYIPKLVLKPVNEAEVVRIIGLSKTYNIPLTFRGSGTSLSGQACGDSVLVVCMHKWQNIKASADSIWCDCGVIGIEANNALKAFGKKIGPDPATINNASIGGIFSNNSSGMCCGVKQNSYQTIKSIRVILHDGFILDTSDADNVQEFVRTHAQMVEQILSLREEIVSDEALRKEIERKFAIKNTTGYALNALSDFADIKDILNHIFIGAEGTLGFVSRVEYTPVKDYALKACALLFYENLGLAAGAIEILSRNDDKVSAAEIMDYACLKAVSGIEGMPQELAKIAEGNCCILIQIESDSKAELDSHIEAVRGELERVPTLFGIEFSFDEATQAKWWKVRKGLLPISAGTKRRGSTVITEDICFEIPNFAKGIEGIGRLFREYAFDGIIFGHALSGNVHFIITPLLSDTKERENFAAFMDKMVELVLSLKGSTKAEHGTGRMMAPFVEQEWGEKAYGLNKRIKAIFDERNLFNPDVIICEDREIHIKNLKPAHSIEDYLEACMECGFCEKVCPSKNITLTPRQRIAVYREIKRLESLTHISAQEREELESLRRDYAYFGVATCATCSMCATLCPLEIDTAKIATNTKNANASKLASTIAGVIARNMDKASKVARFSVGAANVGASLLGSNVLKSFSTSLNRALHTPIVPKYMPTKNTYALESKMLDSIKSTMSGGASDSNLPQANCSEMISPSPVYKKGVSPSGVDDALALNGVLDSKNSPVCSRSGGNEGLALIDDSKFATQTCIKNNDKILYLTSCLNRVFAPPRQAADKRPIQAVFESLCAKAGISVLYPKNIAKMCCGKAFKDFTTKDPSLNPLHHTLQELLEASENGAIPIVCDHSACSGELVEQLKHLRGFEALRVVDMSVYVRDEILPRVRIAPLSESVGVYAVCSCKRHAWAESIYEIAAHCTRGEVVTHPQTYCCGFAGNKGFSTPELNTSALEGLAEHFATHKPKRMYATSSTCEIGLSESTNHAWQHIIYLLDEVAQSRESVQAHEGAQVYEGVR